MFLKQLDLRDFRNYACLDLRLWPGVMLFHGQNAQGKTNLLEALYYASFLTSFRAEKEKDLPRFGTNAFFIRVLFTDNHEDQPEGDLSEKVLEIEVQAKPFLKKRISLDGKPIPRKSAKSILPSVYFGPDDLFMIKGSSSMRRNFLDSLLARVDRVYEEELSRYENVLERRNAFLKKCDPGSSWNRAFESLTDLLISLGASIFEKRLRFMDRLSPLIKDFYRYLSANDCTITYSSAISLENRDRRVISDNFRKHLLGLKEAEKGRGMTLSGPHRDDMVFTLGNSSEQKTFRYYGSQGEQRSLVLALKLAEGKILESHFMKKPIFLFDDVLSELDQQRRDRLLSSLDPSYQVFITSTDFFRVKDDFFHAYKVEKNSIHPEEISHRN